MDQSRLGLEVGFSMGLEELVPRQVLVLIQMEELVFSLLNVVKLGLVILVGWV